GDQYHRAAGPLHGVQPRQALLGLLRVGDPFDQEPGLLRAVDDHDGHAGEELPAVTPRRFARVEVEHGQPLDRFVRGEKQRRHGSVDVAGVLTRDMKRHPASMPSTRHLTSRKPYLHPKGTTRENWDFWWVERAENVEHGDAATRARPFRREGITRRPEPRPRR